MLSAIECRGNDARGFLQNQITADLRELNQGQTLFSGYCNVKGRVICTFIVYCQIQKRSQDNNESFLLILSTDLTESVKTYLQKYIFRSKVMLALSDINIEEIVSKKPEQSWNDWLAYENKNFRVWINASTSEKFTPQMLGLDINGGVSFTKGCYPGQEVVARTHYLGKAKRAVYLADINNHEIITDSAKVVNNEGSEVGVVIQSTTIENNSSLLLSLNNEQVKESLLLVNKSTKTPLTILEVMLEQKANA